MRKRISVSDLRVGMYIEEFCGSWMDHPFWGARFVVDNEVDLRRVQDSRLTEVWIDAGKGLDVPSKDGAHEPLEEARNEFEERRKKVAIGA